MAIGIYNKTYTIRMYHK